MTCYHASIASALALRIISYDKCLTLLHLPVHILHTHAYARRFTVRAVLRCAALDCEINCSYPRLSKASRNAGSPIETFASPMRQNFPPEKIKNYSPQPFHLPRRLLAL